MRLVPILEKLILLAILPACAAPDASPPKPQRIQVFVLAGQSNMEGQAVVDLDHEKHYNGGRGTLARLLDDPEQATRFRHLRDASGSWTERDDVHVWYRAGKDARLKAGKLSIGYAVYPGKHHFGPELQFGHVIGDALDAPVLLVKTAWGGKSLFKDFRSPSAGGTVGPYYTKMLAECREALDNLGRYFPEYDGREYEIAGFVWFQGWNDMYDKQAVADYESNLAHLIRDVRKHFALPNLPIVVGETGNAGKATFRANQAAISKRAEFAGNLIFVPTREFLRPREQSPNVGHGHHWFGNAESYFLIGDAFGQAMLELLGTK